jgi:hypothetical protein
MLVGARVLMFFTRTKILECGGKERGEGEKKKEESVGGCSHQCT